MPTTTYVDATMGASVIGARTDNAGTPVIDLSAEEARYSNLMLGEGYVKPTNAFVPVAGAGATMNTIFGSGSAKADYYLVAGDLSGQGNYLVRLASATETVTLDAADGSNPRIDEVYLVVHDNAYDASSRALPRFGYRKGDAAASPSAPGADSSWDAEVLLLTIQVPTSAADILACTLTDERLGAVLSIPGLTLLDTTGLDAGGGDITNVGLVDTIDVAAHTHDGTGGDGAVVDAADLTGLQAAVNAANVDADTLDGIDSLGFTLIAHEGAGGVAHADVVAGGADGFMTGGDKTKLDGIDTAAKNDQILTAGTMVSITGSPDYTIAHATVSPDTVGDVSGAAVLDQLDFDAQGHLINGTTRALTPSDIGAATAAHDHDGDYYTNSGATPSIKISTSSPSGGSNGDVWFKYV